MSRLFIIIFGLLMLVSALPLAAQTDVFQIAYGDTISDGAPGPGAGNIEIVGAQDIYTFDATAGDEAIFDSVVGNNGVFGWRLVAPDGTLLVDSFNVDRRLTLPVTGTYTFTVRGFQANTTGVYSFRLLLVPPPQLFAISIGDTISNGVPTAGAGNLEVPGAVDIYTFEGTAGGGVIFDALVGNTGLARVILTAPDGTELFNGFYLDQQAAFSQTGTYTLQVEGLNITSTGVYSFQLLNIAAPQIFTIRIGDMVSDGVPAPGAGNLEGPGAVDMYTFDGVAGQVMIFDALVGNTGQFRVILTAPDGTEMFEDFYLDRQVTLPQSGTYELRITGSLVTNFGTYSFQLINVPPDAEAFTISLGDTVSDGVPAAGAGNLEVPGAVDVYNFDGVAGQEIIFDTLAGDTGQFRISLTAPDGTEMFDDFYQDRQVTLPQTGTYNLRVTGGQITFFGTYSFQLLSVPPAAQEFTINLGDTVSDGVPTAGAGNLEVPGAVDIYRFEGAAGQNVIFDALVGNTGQFRVILTAPDDMEVFSDFYIDRQVTLPQTGTYSLTVQGLNVTDFGVYSFALLAAATNSPPVANDDNTVTDEDTAVTILVLANDTDGDGDSLTVESVTQPVNGVVVNNGADVTYSPNANFNGLDSFTYTVSDGNGGMGTAMVPVTVNPVNDSPTLDISTDAVEVNEGDTVTRAFTASDVDGDTLTAQASPGTVNDLGNGSFEWSYLADDGPATITVTITVSDGQGGTASASFDLTVLNVPPSAVFANTTGTITAPGSVTLAFNSQTDPSQADTNAGFLYSYDCTNAGTFLLAQSTSPTFNCPYDTAGVYTARGRIEDKDGGFTDLFAEVVVEAPVNSAPDAQDDLATTAEDVSVVIPVLANDTDADGDSLTVESVTQPANGIVINNGADVTYTPNANFNGVDSFIYTASDGNGGIDTAVVTVTVNPVNDSPVSSDDSAVTDVGVQVIIDVLANDTDIDGDPLIVSSVTQPANGSIINNGVNVTYSPNGGFSGVDSFAYTASDPSGGSAAATVMVTVNPVGVPGEVTVVFQVNQSSDDANEDGTWFGARSATVWIGNGGSVTSDYLGLRFNGVTIPAGAFIQEAYIEVYAPNGGWINVQVEFAAEAIGSSPPFDWHNRPSQRALTAARVEHRSNTPWPTNSWNQFENIASVVQEIVNRGDWASGNNLSIIARGIGQQWGRKFVTSYDGSPALAPRLVVRYTQNQAALSAPGNNPATPLPTEVPVTPLSPTLTDTPAERASTETPPVTPTDQPTIEPTPPEVLSEELSLSTPTQTPTAESIQELIEAPDTPTSTEEVPDG